MILKLDNPIQACELKFAGKKGEFEGYASVFNGIDAVLDTILPGAYEKTLKSDRSPAMFINHDSWGIPVGDWVALSEDSTGLHVKGKIDMNHKDGPSVYSALERKAMDALSIGFRIPAGGAEEKENGIREISEIDLKEISIVNFPADDAARISNVKNEIIQIESLKEAELFLRDSGYSKSSATAFVSRLRDLIRCDTGDLLNDEITKLKQNQQISNNTQKLIDFIEQI